MIKLSEEIVEEILNSYDLLLDAINAIPRAEDEKDRYRLAHHAGSLVTALKEELEEYANKS